MHDMATQVEEMCAEVSPPKAYTKLREMFPPEQAQGGGASTSTEPALKKSKKEPETTRK